MSMIIFPAPGGTHLVNRDDGVIMPIIGFAYVQGNLAFPLFAIAGKNGCGKEEAILHPDGYISYPAGNKMFASLTEWQEWMQDQSEDAELAEVAGAPDTSPIKFGSNTYKTTSYWHWPTANAVFEIPGNEPLPDDPRVLKVKRDEFAAAKRAGAVKIDPHAGIIEDEPEQKAEAPADEDDDNDVI